MRRIKSKRSFCFRLPQYLKITIALILGYYIIVKYDTGKFYLQKECVLTKKKTEMTQALFEVLRGYSDFCTIISDELPNNAGVISIIPLTMSPAELDTYLAQNGICVRSGLHCAPLAHKQMKTAPKGQSGFR